MSLLAALAPADVLAAAQRRADCRRRQVGAVLVSPEGEVVASGWNGLPSGSCSAGECPRGLLTYEQQPAFQDYAATGCTAVHAEVMALRRAGDRAQGCTAWVTASPCPGCADALARSGVVKVVVVRLEG